MFRRIGFTEGLSRPSVRGSTGGVIK